MEAARQVQSLARYRFLLSCKLGGEPPIWRWELFKTTAEGSIRSWTNPSNIFVGFFALGTSLGAFVFVNPAVGDAVVNTVRWFSGLCVGGLVVTIGWAGWARRDQNEVADPPPIDGTIPGPEHLPQAGGTTYDSLRPQWARSLAPSSEKVVPVQGK